MEILFKKKYSQLPIRAQAEAKAEREKLIFPKDDDFLQKTDFCRRFLSGQIFLVSSLNKSLIDINFEVDSGYTRQSIYLLLLEKFQVINNAQALETFGFDFDNLPEQSYLLKVLVSQNPETIRELNLVQIQNCQQCTTVKDLFSQIQEYQHEDQQLPIAVKQRNNNADIVHQIYQAHQKTFKEATNELLKLKYELFFLQDSKQAIADRLVTEIEDLEEYKSIVQEFDLKKIKIQDDENDVSVPIYAKKETQCLYKGSFVAFERSSLELLEFTQKQVNDLLNKQLQTTIFKQTFFHL